MKRNTFGWIALPVIAVAVAAATVYLAGGPTAAQAVATSPHQTVRAADEAWFPSAAEFARVFVGTTNAYAAEHGDPRRIGHAHCVQASPGHYMCAFSSTQPGEPRQCRLMQARWTPERASMITVTLGGRTGRCGSVREAIDSLQ